MQRSGSVRPMLVLGLLMLLAPAGETQHVARGGEASTPNPSATTESVSSVQSPPRFIFASEVGMVVELSDRYAPLFAECVARWPGQLDQQAPMGAMLPEPVAQHISSRVTEQVGDAYQLLRFGAATCMAAHLTRLTYHSSGAHAGLDGFMGLLRVPGWTPEVPREMLRPVGLAWRTTSPRRFTEPEVPSLSEGDLARSRKALEAAFPGWDIPDAEVRALGRMHNGNVGVVSVLHGNETKDVLLGVTMLQDDAAYVVPIDADAVSILCPNRFAFFLQEGNPEHCAPVLNGAYFILPDIFGDGNPSLAIVSDTASSLLQFRVDTSSPNPLAGYVLEEVTGFSYGF